MLDVIVSTISNMPQNTALWLIVTLFISLDVILGISNALINKELSSSVARDGVKHKVGFFGSLLLCNFIDIAQSLTFLKDTLGFTVPVSVICAVMIITCEIISICETLTKLNPNLNLSFIIKKE